MRFNAECLGCLIQKQASSIKEHPDEEKKLHYMKEILQLILDTPEELSSPYLVSRFQEIKERYFGPEDDGFAALKSHYNRLMMAQEDTLRDLLHRQPDPLSAALTLSRAGNYIDFGTQKEVDESQLKTLLSGAMEESLPEDVYRGFRRAMENAKTFVHLCDNCGEIVLDKLLLEVIRETYPQLSITAIVRGKPILNDATMEDATEVGLTKDFTVIPNGSGIAGTQLGMLSDEAQRCIEEADVILSKGQGNFESLHGCGLPIYYLFLCKCDLFVRRFQKPPMTGIFGEEKQLKGYFSSETN